MGNKLSAHELDAGGAEALSRRLRDGASPDARFTVDTPRTGLRRGARCSPLCYALLLGEQPLVEALLRYGADPARPAGFAYPLRLRPLHLAVALGRAPAVRLLLLRAGADPNAPLEAAGAVGAGAEAAAAVARGPAPAAEVGGGAAGLAGAAAAWDWEGPVGAAAGSAGGVPRAGLVPSLQAGDTPLHLAAACGHAEALAALLLHPAANANAFNTAGATPLAAACAHEQVACAALLVLHPGVDVNAGLRAPLFAAVGAGSAELVRLLLQAGADPSALNGGGQTLLQAAAALERHMRLAGRADAVRLALEGGAAAVGPVPVQQQQRQQPARQQLRGQLLASAARSAGLAPPVRAGQQAPAVAAATAAAPHGQRRRQGGSVDGPRCPRRHIWWYLPAAALLRARARLSLVPLTAVVTAALLSHQLAGLVVHAVRRCRRRGPQQPPGGLHSSSAAGDGAASACRQLAGGGGDEEGLVGLCCVCMVQPAEVGFVHADVVHCCLCAGCEGEMRLRDRLARCLICQRAAPRTIRVVGT